jgi:hypothetical protein
MSAHSFPRLGISVKQVSTGVGISLLIDLKIKIIDTFNWNDLSFHNIPHYTVAETLRKE